MPDIPEVPQEELQNEEDAEISVIPSLYEVDKALAEMDRALGEIDHLLHLMLFLTELAASEMDLDREALQQMLDRLIDKIDRIAGTL